MTDTAATMSLLEHLEELRSRIVVVALALAAASVVGFIVSVPVIGALQAAAPDGTDLIQLGVGEALGVRLRLGLIVGLAIAMPVVLYQAWAFVTPGLTPRERRFVWPLLGAAIVLFALGLAVGYAVVPVALTFLIGLALPGVPPMLGLAEYVGFVSTLMIAFGLAFEFPVLLILLARVGVLSYRFLASRRRWIVLIIVLFAILITPGGDPLSSSVMSVILYGLFEGTLQLIRLMGR